MSNFTIETSNIDIVLRDSQISALGLVSSGAIASGSPTSCIVTPGTTSTSIASTATSSIVSNGSTCVPTSSTDNTLNALQASDNTKLIAVGVAVGVSLGLALIVALVLVGVEKVRNKRLATEHSQVSLERTALQGRVRDYELQEKQRSAPMYEISSARRPDELSAGTPAHELPDSVSHSGNMASPRG